MKKQLLFLVLAFCFLLPIARAAVPHLLTYQGILKDGTGNLLTGNYSMTFRIYSAASGGTALWNETQSGVSAASGKFSVQLGSVTSLNLDFGGDYWLSIQVGADAEMSPRVRLTSVGYAYRADSVVNGFSQSQHDGLDHKNIEGVKDNTVLIGKTNFKLDAYTAASANSMGDMLLDTFTDSTGIDSGASSDYAWRGTPNYDVAVASSYGGIDSYTVLMLHLNGTDASTTFTDSSNNPHTMSYSGQVEIDTAQSKLGGASAYVAGDDDWISSAAHNDWDLGAGDFTIDFWVRFSTVSQAQRLFAIGNSDVSIVFNSSTQTVSVDIMGNTVLTPSWSPATNNWYHVALARSGTSLKLYIGGTQLGSTITNSTNIQNSTGLQIGGGGGTLLGWLDEVRLSKGIARWTSNFTPPGQEYTTTGGGGTATVISTAFAEPSVPTTAMVIADETLGTGTITYYVSRDNGTTWTQCTKETVTSISAQPSGTQLKWKAVITGNAELNSIAVAV